ncbi:L-histidine N(alpha)-methyltransferase [Flavobacteriaceae bacterium TP-CH-4]|uniref:L-histidine N(Alpha)-methyltransferase n=1 Tax=Pelagihabitans pacificus TaxID=2696054 RepID=A0A967E6W5_9FLAO|nr:L-histidine N(alpha)-methyltransferase [Pelagihabitans pacificus]NHF60962.1 L-histidine N(alpha)-methyltransferase [Pelagihabitans pacificus]
MQQETATTFETQFEEEVHDGLNAFPKRLPSKYFYDEIGDKLFQDIMHMPEYYLTDAELEIFETHKAEITERFAADGQPFNLIELGAGDGKKTKILLKQLSEKNIDFTYEPIDISQNVLDGLESSLHRELPEVKVATQQGTYFEALERINTDDGTRKVILFLGSNIGNLLHEQAIVFLKHVQDLMQEDDLFFVGLDQKKNPQTILDAYNDPAGITAEFNKNILRRINRELEANFRLDAFLHWEVYDPETGTAKSYLVSKKRQTVEIKKLDLDVNFEAWETIHTEISQKYDDATVAWLAEQSGLQVTHQFADQANQFKNYIFKKRE